MKLCKCSKALISIYILKGDSFSLSNVLNTEETLNRKIKDMAEAAYSMFSGIIIMG